MKWYKLVVAYDGTDFAGWQQQPQQQTIEGVLKKTFLRVFDQKHVYLVGASRTDAGVHAKGQVVRIGTDVQVAPEKCMKVLNNALPLTIAITSIEPVARAFHPQHNVTSKTYSYRIFTQRPSVHEQRFGYYYWHPFDKELLHKSLQLFVGTHDFSLLSKKQGERNPMRTILSITVNDETEHSLLITITGISFLQYMVRRIVGLALEIASDSQKEISEIKLLIETLLSGKRILQQILPTAPAKGLCLEKIIYHSCEENYES